MFFFKKKTPQPTRAQINAQKRAEAKAERTRMPPKEQNPYYGVHNEVEERYIREVVNKTEEESKKSGKVKELVVHKKNAVYYKSFQSFFNAIPIIFWVAATSFMILGGALYIANLTAGNAKLRASITSAERALREVQARNLILEEDLRERFTYDEIERFAIERLGMSFPDPMQIIHIYVPRVGSVILNTDESALPRQRIFRDEVFNFLTELANRIFGGD